jgi:hypothetical protein
MLIMLLSSSNLEVKNKFLVVLIRRPREILSNIEFVIFTSSAVIWLL